MFVDSHAHIDGPEYDADRDEVVARARAAGVVAILNVGTGDPHSGALERAVEVAEHYEGVYAAAGVHPHDARLFGERAAERLQQIMRSSALVLAWGEIGLDYHYDNSPRDVQRAVFAQQLRLARAAERPVIIHSREADEDTAAILRAEWGDASLGGIMHCFGGGWALAEAALELDFMISFAGNVTFKNAGALRDIAQRIPLDRLLVETDCPFLTPVPFRGRRNEPARVVETARVVAGLHQLDPIEFGRITNENFARLFKLQL
jgi:TatD DNase family protein